MAGQEGEEAVILVVGPETDYKRCFADALADGCGASRKETTKAGCRIFSRESSRLEAVVIDTTAMVVYEDCSLPLNAMKWISTNSLRRILKKLVLLVCVVDSFDLRDPTHLKVPGPLPGQFSWLHLLGSIFKIKQEKILIFVKQKVQVNLLSAAQERAAITQVLGQNGFQTAFIGFETMRREHLLPVVTIALKCSVKPRVEQHDKEKNSTLEFCQVLADGTNAREDTAPSVMCFTLEELVQRVMTGSEIDRSRRAVMDVVRIVNGPTRWEKYVARHGPWSSERVILFGRTGSGKSTLAQMLTSGRVDPGSKVFASSSSIRGTTTAIKSGEGRGWYIVDTPGFGEIKDKQSTVPTEEAEKRVKDYVRRIEGTYSHFVYVNMKGRIDELDTNLWAFFKLLYGEKLLKHFTVVVSNATQKWVDNNIRALHKNFTGCKSFVGCEFPPTDDNMDVEAEHEDFARKPSLKRLEDELASQSRYPVTCDFGLHSKKSIEHTKAKHNLEAVEHKNFGRRVLYSLHADGVMALTQSAELMKPLLGKESNLLPNFDVDRS